MAGTNVKWGVTKGWRRLKGFKGRFPKARFHSFKVSGFVLPRSEPPVGWASLYGQNAVSRRPLAGFCVTLLSYASGGTAGEPGQGHGQRTNVGPDWARVAGAAGGRAGRYGSRCRLPGGEDCRTAHFRGCRRQNEPRSGRKRRRGAGGFAVHPVWGRASRQAAVI